MITTEKVLVEEKIVKGKPEQVSRTIQGQYLIDTKNKTWSEVGSKTKTPYLTLVGPELGKSLIIFGAPSKETDFQYRTCFSAGIVTKIASK